MRKQAILRLLLFAAAILPFGAKAEGVFSDRLYSMYSMTYDLNESGDYLKAYSLAGMTRRMMATEMQKAGKNVSTITDDDFKVFYWPISKSTAEIAYKLGLYMVMYDIEDEMNAALVNRQVDRSDEYVRGMMADVAKIAAGRYFLTEKYPHAERELRRALDLKPYDNDFIYAVRDELAQLYYKQGSYRNALTQIDMALKNPMFDTASRLPYAEEKRMETLQQRAICLARLNRFDEALSTIDETVKYFKSKDTRKYAEALRKKGKILVLQAEASNGSVKPAHKCYEEYFALAKGYVDTHFVSMSESAREQFWMAEQPFVTDCYRLEDEAPALLYDVALFSKAVLLQMGRTFREGMTRQQRREALANVRVTWRDVQRRLPDSAAAIEFIIYEKGGTRQIAALVLRKTAAAPEFVHIAPLDAISGWLLPDSSSLEEIVNKGSDAEYIDSIYNSKELRSLIWNDRLVRAIGDSRIVYFTPDGILFRLAIEYLLPDALEGRTFHRLTSTSVLTESRGPIRRKGMLAVGDINYLADTGMVSEGGNDAMAYTLLSNLQPSLDRLLGSRVEIDTILALRANSADTVLRADSATETALRNLMSKYSILHISTHGFSYETRRMGNDLRPAPLDELLSRSCIFLSGAEKNLDNAAFDASLQDGILSAREIAGMDLSDIDLAIMSACVTGAGIVTPDGLYGLQRGMKAAGVGAMVVSLWNVDDASTALMMRLLYANLEEGMPLREAFDKARRSLRDDFFPRRRYGIYREERFDRPYYYDAFILIDGIAK